MKNKESSNVFTVGLGETAVATMFRGTTDSEFSLIRGVPSNEMRKLDEYLWTPVFKNGHPVTLKMEVDNPIAITIPGTYKFVNNGTDDEEAIIDVTVYKGAVE